MTEEDMALLRKQIKETLDSTYPPNPNAALKHAEQLERALDELERLQEENARLKKQSEEMYDSWATTQLRAGNFTKEYYPEYLDGLDEAEGIKQAAGALEHNSLLKSGNYTEDPMADYIISKGEGSAKFIMEERFDNFPWLWMEVLSKICDDIPKVPEEISGKIEPLKEHFNKWWAGRKK